MSNIPSTGASSATGFSRLALLGGGVALTAVGLAAGLALRRPAASPDPAPVVAMAPAGAASLPAPVYSPATAAAPAPVPAVRGAQAAPRQQPERSSGREVARGSSAEPAYRMGTQPVVACASCGVVESVRAVQQKGQGTGLGAVAGGVVGGLLGNRFGGGNGRSAMTLLGAVGGGMAGNEIEKRQRSKTVYEVRVRMDSGEMRSFTESTAPATGTRVQVEGHQLRALSSAGPTPAPAAAPVDGAANI